MMDFILRHQWLRRAAIVLYIAFCLFWIVPLVCVVSAVYGPLCAIKGLIHGYVYPVTVAAKHLNKGRVFSNLAYVWKGGE